MRALAARIVLSLAPALAQAQAGGWNLYGADGSYQGSYDRGSNRWDGYDANGQYQGRISGQGDPRIKSGEGLPAVIGAGQQ